MKQLFCFESEVDELNVKTPFESFEKLFGSALELILEETVRYASQKNVHDFSISEGDIKAFIGILYFSGYHKLPY